MVTLMRREIQSLKRELQECIRYGDPFQLKGILTQIVSLSNKDVDLEPLLPEVVKILAHPDLLVKKVSGDLLVQYSQNNTEIVLLAINTLIHDAEDSNPMVRGQALKTLSSLQQEVVVEHLERLVDKGLKDDNAYVRRAAVVACSRLYQMMPSSLKNTGKVDALYSMIRDSDPVVVATSLQVLEEVLRDEGGVVVNRPIAHHLLAHLKDFPAWSLAQVLRILTKYSPADEDEVFSIMNVLDDHLTHNSPAVNVTCLQLFQHVLTNLPHLQPEVFKRCKDTLVSHLTPTNAELSFQIICIITEAPEKAVGHFCDRYQSFFCHNRDPAYLKLKKIQILLQLMTEGNVVAIIEELGRYCLSESPDVSLAAIQAVSQTYKKYSHSPELSSSCIQQLMNLVESSSHVLSNFVQILQDMTVADKGFWDSLLVTVCHRFTCLRDDAGKAAALNLIGEHMQNSPLAVSILEQCVGKFPDWSDRDLKIQLLDATSRMFLSNPFELQLLLGGLLEMAVSDVDLEVKNRAVFLYQLLKSGVDNAKAVLFSTLSL